MPACPDIAADLLDVLIVGAAHHLQRRCPSKRYAILEARQSIGGTAQSHRPEFGPRLRP